MGSGNETAEAELSRGDLSDPWNMNVYNLNSQLYPGDEDSFYVQFINDYDGTGFEGSSAPINSSQLKEVKITIVTLLDENMNPVSLQPVTWTEKEAHNNNGDGFTIDRYNGAYFYAGTGSESFAFRVKTTGLMIGTYNIQIMISYRFMVDWDGGTLYTWNSDSTNYYQSFTINSAIMDGGPAGYEFQAFRESLSTENLHSGAQSKLFGIYSLYSASGTITDIEATVAFPGSGITADQATITSPTLTNYLLWRITVPAETPAGFYDVSLQLSYLDDGSSIVELATIHTFRVEYTPLFFTPQSGDLSDPFITFSRDELPDSLTIPVRNGGNVELHGVKVTLDLDNTRYVDGTSYYYNEEYNAGLNQMDLDVTIETLDVGESASVTFETLNFLPRLPPGLYKLPIDYTSYYTDDGRLGGSAREIMTGLSNDEGYYNQRDIMRRIQFPEDRSSDFYQYILIKILPDPDGPMMDGYVDSNANQDPGNVNQYMRIRVQNYEMFDLKNLVYHIHTDMGSPFLRPFSNTNDSSYSTLEPIFRAGLSDSSGTGTSNDYVYFYASIRSDAIPGINYFYVDVEGYTEFNQPFNKTFLAYITIDAHQPRFEVVSVETGDILADRSVEITAEIINVGLGGAWNLTCYFKSSNTGYVHLDEPIEVGSVMSGDTFLYSFHVKPESERRYFNGNYYGYVYFSYFDDIGDFDELMSGNNLQVRYDLYDKLPDLRIIKVDAPVVDRGDTFEVDVTVMNIGGSETIGLKAIIPYNSNLFSIITEEQNLTDLGPEESQTITFEIKAGKEMSDGTTYSFSILFSYTDILGRERTFSEGESESFTVRTKDRIIPSEQIQIVEDDGAVVSPGAGSVILGIFILIAAIIFGGIITGGREMMKNMETKEVKRTSSRPKAEKLAFDEDEEDDEMDEEEEEEEVDEEEDEEDW